MKVYSSLEDAVNFSSLPDEISNKIKRNVFEKVREMIGDFDASTSFVFIQDNDVLFFCSKPEIHHSVLPDGTCFGKTMIKNFKVVFSIQEVDQ